MRKKVEKHHQKGDRTNRITREHTQRRKKREEHARVHTQTIEMI
jgi:hypothetical protein